MAWKHRKSSAQRMGPGWQRIREQVLRRDCFVCQCASCKAAARVRTASEVDHIVPRALGGTNDLSNLIAINHQCHVEKTLREQGKEPRPRIGVDGWPIA